MPLRHLKGIPAVKAVMTSFPHSIEADAVIGEARQMMELHRIRHLPVKDGGRLVGVVSDRDVQRTRLPGGRGDAATVREVCRMEAYVVDLHHPLDRVLLHMADEQVDAALVVKESRLAGIFTMTDACRALGELLRGLTPPGGGDEAA